MTFYALRMRALEVAVLAAGEGADLDRILDLADQAFDWLVEDEEADEGAGAQSRDGDRLHS